MFVLVCLCVCVCVSLSLWVYFSLLLSLSIFNGAVLQGSAWAHACKEAGGKLRKTAGREEEEALHQTALLFGSRLFFLRCSSGLFTVHMSLVARATTSAPLYAPNKKEDGNEQVFDLLLSCSPSVSHCGLCHSSIIVHIVAA